MMKGKKSKEWGDVAKSVERDGQVHEIPQAKQVLERQYKRTFPSPGPTLSTGVGQGGTLQATRKIGKACTCVHACLSHATPLTTAPSSTPAASAKLPS
eukprot:1136151-Pelagomonas_calceolata.AAC.6